MKKILNILAVVICSILVVQCSKKLAEKQEEDRLDALSPCYDYKMTGADPLIFPIQQGHAKLSVPQAVFDQARPPYRKDKCIPLNMRLVFAFNTKTQKLVNDYDKITTEDKSFIKYQVIAVEIEDLSFTPKEMLPYIEDTQKIEPKRYEPRYKMKHYPLWFHPNAFYDNPYPPTDRAKYGWSIIGFKQDLANKPNTFQCSFEYQIVPSDKEQTIQNLLNAKIINTHYPCKDGLLIEKDGTVLRLIIWIQPEALPYIDTIYKELTANIKSYLSSSNQPNQSTPQTN